MGHEAYLRKALDVLFPTVFCTNRSSDERVMAPGSRGVGVVFVHFSDEDSGQTGDVLVVAGVVIFPRHPGSKINLLRVGKTLRAKAAVREEKRILLPARFFSNLVPVRARF